MSKVSQGVQHNNPFPPFPRRSAAEDLPLLCAKAPPPEGHQMTGPTMVVPAAVVPWQIANLLMWILGW